MKKEIIILDKPKGCRLANQLWNYISIYAYCLEKGYKCKNYCFYEDKKRPTTKTRSYDNYYRYFNIPKSNFIKFFLWLHIAITKKTTKPRIFHRYVDYIKKRHNEKIIYSGGKDFFNLPPSKIKNKEQAKQIEKLEEAEEKTYYFDGWHFRNPEGIKKYYLKIKKHFQPKKEITKKINAFLKEQRKKYKKIVGVHIRQRDYKFLFENSFYFNQEQANEILNQYLDFFQLNKQKILFIICSDDKVDEAAFSGLNVSIKPRGVVEDLYLLSQTDLVIGTDSTFGPFAAYYGNIPFIVFEKKIEWEFYKNKNEYFENYKCKNLFHS